MDQEPITINYIVDIQEFTTDQIKQLRTSVNAIAGANDYNSAVDNTDGTPKDLVLKPYIKASVFQSAFYKNTRNS